MAAPGSRESRADDAAFLVQERHLRGSLDFPGVTPGDDLHASRPPCQILIEHPTRRLIAYRSRLRHLSPSAMRVEHARAEALAEVDLGLERIRRRLELDHVELQAVERAA